MNKEGDAMNEEFEIEIVQIINGIAIENIVLKHRKRDDSEEEEMTVKRTE